MDKCPKCSETRTPRSELDPVTFDCGTFIDPSDDELMVSDRCKLNVAERERDEARALARDANSESEKCLAALDEICIAILGEKEKPIAEMVAELTRLREQLAELRRRLLSAAGDDLCRLTPEEIKAYTSGAVQIPPKEEFIASCERFHSQIAGEAGVLNGCLTLAQLIAENEKQRARIADYDNQFSRISIAFGDKDARHAPDGSDRSFAAMVESELAEWKSRYELACSAVTEANEQICSLTSDNAAQAEEIELYESMKEGVQVRITDLEAEIERLRCELQGAHQDGELSGISKASEPRDKIIDTLNAEIERLRADAERFDRRGADKLAYECARAVQEGRVGSRSAIGDALLNYLEVGGMDGPRSVPEWMEKYAARKEQPQ